MKIFKESEQYIQEKSSIVSTIKAALSIFPLGAPIVSIFNDWQNQIQIRTIESTIVKCFEKISAIEESINIAYLHSNEFIYDLKQTIFKVKDEINEEYLNVDIKIKKLENIIKIKLKECLQVKKLKFIMQ